MVRSTNLQQNQFVMSSPGSSEGKCTSMRNRFSQSQPSSQFTTRKMDSNTPGRSPVTRSPKLEYLMEIVQDFFMIIYLVLYGVYTFTIGVPFRWLVPPKQKSLKDEVIVAVGANSSGVSKAVCKCLAKERAKALILIDTSAPDEQLLELLRKSCARSVYFQIDSYTRESLDAAIDKIKVEFAASPVTSIFLLTEMISVGPLLSTSTDETLEIFQSNLLSAFHVIQRFFTDFLENNRGHIVSVGYPAFTSWGKTTLVPYISSKCGLEGFTYSIEDEVRNHLNKENIIKFTDVFVKLHSTQCALDSGASIRHPTLFPVLSDETIAEGVVDGYRRNKRYAYVPGSLGLSLWFESFVPTHFIKKARSLLYPCGSP